MIVLNDSEIFESLEIYGDLYVHGDIKATGNIICSVESNITAFCDKDLLIRKEGLTILNNKIYVNGKYETNPAKIGLALMQHLDSIHQDMIKDYYSEDIFNEDEE